VRVSLLATCVVDLLEPDVGEASARLLRAAGCEVRLNRAQTCCGQPGWNAGHAEEAAAVARPTLEALGSDLDDGADAVVVPAGSCASMVRVFWPELFEVVGDHEAAALARRVGEATLELSELLAGAPVGCRCWRWAGRWWSPSTGPATPCGSCASRASRPSSWSGWRAARWHRWSPTTPSAAAASAARSA
jgi:hypothetical protein